MDPAVSLAIRKWRDWKVLGMLPGRGSMGEQPAQTVAILRVCEDESSAAQADAFELARNKELKRGP